MISLRRIRRGVAAVASAGLLALGLGAVAPVSNAANVINPNATYTITVHAQKGPVGTAATGTEADNPSHEAVAEAKFKLEKSTLDVTTGQGYAKAKEGTFDTADTSFTEGAEKATGADGTASFTGLKPGYYKLVQTKAPVGLSPAKDSYILVPLTDPNTGTYMDTIHVYPKSTDAGTVTKKDITPETSLVTKGSTMDFQIDASIRNLATGHKFDKFVVTDTPITGLEVNGAKGKVTKVEIVETADATTAAETLADGDFQVTDGAAENVEKKVVTLTAPGLEKVSAKQGKFLRVTIQATVAANVGEKVSNSASNTNKADDETSDTEVSTPGGDQTPTTLMGKLKIQNFKTNTTEALTGAKFKVFLCEGTEGVTGNALSIDGKNEFAANELIGPMRAMSTKKLCVKQTVAPKGYELNPAATQVAFDEAAIKAAEAAGGDKAVVATVYNSTTSEFTSKLPLTGGAGIVLFVLIGAGLLAVAYRRARKDA